MTLPRCGQHAVNSTAVKDLVAGSPTARTLHRVWARDAAMLYPRGRDWLSVPIEMVLHLGTRGAWPPAVTFLCPNRRSATATSRQVRAALGDLRVRGPGGPTGWMDVDDHGRHVASFRAAVAAHDQGSLSLSDIVVVHPRVTPRRVAAVVGGSSSQVLATRARQLPNGPAGRSA